MVLGDHGMADLGGHGGTSIPEIIIPLITFGLGCGGIHELVCLNSLLVVNSCLLIVYSIIVHNGFCQFLLTSSFILFVYTSIL